MDTRYLDRLASDLGVWFGLDTGRVTKLIRSLTDLVFGHGQGEVDSFIGLFERAGLGHLPHSWLGGAANEAIAPNQVVQVLGPQSVMRIAKELGVRSSIAAGAISAALPGLISESSNDGALPANAPDPLVTWLDLRSRGGRKSWRGSSIVREWAPWLMAGLLLIATLFVIRGCSQADASHAPAARTEAHLP